MLPGAISGVSKFSLGQKEDPFISARKKAQNCPKPPQIAQITFIRSPWPGVILPQDCSRPNDSTNDLNFSAERE